MGKEELKKKRKIRGGHKGCVTTLEKVQTLLDDFESSSANQLKTYRISLTEKLNILGALDDEILALIKEDQIEDETSPTGTFRQYRSNAPHLSDTPTPLLSGLTLIGA